MRNLNMLEKLYKFVLRLLLESFNTASQKASYSWGF